MDQESSFPLQYFHWCFCQIAFSQRDGRKLCVLSWTMRSEPNGNYPCHYMYSFSRAEWGWSGKFSTCIGIFTNENSGARWNESSERSFATLNIYMGFLLQVDSLKAEKGQHANWSSSQTHCVYRPIPLGILLRDNRILKKITEILFLVRCLLSLSLPFSC